jgi:hypothetical protein
VASLLEVFEARLSVLLGPILKPLHAAANLVATFYTNLTNLLSDTQHLADSAIAEYKAIKGFKLGGSAQFKNRVILLPRFNESVSILVSTPEQIFHAVADLVSLLREKLRTARGESDTAFDPAESEDLAQLKESFAKLGTRLGTKVAKAGERLFIFLGFAVETVNDIHNAIKDMQTIVDAIKTVRTDFESLDAFFLPQGSRKVKTTTTYRKRIR